MSLRTISTFLRLLMFGGLAVNGIFRGLNRYYFYIYLI